NVSATRIITVTAPPVVGTLSGNQNICVGQTSSFASTSSGGTWASSDSTVATIGSASGLVTAVASGTATMTYTVLGTGGCANVSATRTVNVTAPPVVGTLSGNQNICVGQTSSFNSTSAGGTWTSSDVTVATIGSASGLVTAVASGTATMTYTVLGTGGCANVSATRTVTVTAPPVVGTLSGNREICQGSNGQFFSTVASGIWSSSAVNIASVNAITGVISGIAAGLATITYTVNGSGGCANVSTSQNVNIKPTPQVIIGTNPISICSENSPNITLAANYPGTTFSWTATQNNVSGVITNGTSILIDPILTSTAMNGGNVFYNIIPTLNGCTGTAAVITVKVNPKPVPVLNSGFICVDVATGNTAQGHLLNTGLSSANHNFQWYFDSDLIPINVNAYQANEAGIYSVIATNTTTGCVSEEVFANVTATIFTRTYTTSVSEAFSDNPYIVIQTPTGSGPFEYQLDNGPWQSSNTFYNMIPGWHTIRIKDEVGCTDLEGEILILGYPKFFTPNGDTYNDTWNISALEKIPNSGIYIFDRYGKFIKQISPLGTGWDGTYNGYPLPSTDYWFTVDFVDPNSGKESTFKSHFSLKR
ncbi:T9SS type B sorting domain-containing protein, partial [Flavobacterium sp. CYK-4]|uniref:T9SS type B sorting domain-containing protein n=1 Tax=Flavobacterium lotistagni TaxID=2709660 RepID=UPI00140E0839